MSLKDLLQSANTEQYNDSPLFMQLSQTKPEYGMNHRIRVALSDSGEIAVTNCHVGSLGDILTYPIDVDPNLNISKTQLLDAILKEMENDGFTAPEQEDFWDDFDNLQKAKIIR
jgi:hypothetical protein